MYIYDGKTESDQRRELRTGDRCKFRGAGDIQRVHAHKPNVALQRIVFVVMCACIVLAFAAAHGVTP